MNRKEIVGAVATHAGMEPREVDKALKGMTEVIEAVAAKGEQVTISGFAKFARVDRPARMARSFRRRTSRTRRKERAMPSRVLPLPPQRARPGSATQRRQPRCPHPS